MHNAVTLKDGNIFLIGDYDAKLSNRNAEIFNPITKETSDFRITGYESSADSAAALICTES